MPLWASHLTVYGLATVESGLACLEFVLQFLNVSQFQNLYR